MRISSLLIAVTFLAPTFAMAEDGVMTNDAKPAATESVKPTSPKTIKNKQAGLAAPHHEKSHDMKEADKSKDGEKSKKHHKKKHHTEKSGDHMGADHTTGGTEQK